MEDATRLSFMGSVRSGAVGVLIAAMLCAWVTVVSAQSRPESAEEHARQAHEAAARDDHAAAIEHATRAIALDASFADALTVLLAHQLTWADRPAEAIPHYRRAIEQRPDDREAKLGLARALSWADRLRDARAVYEGLVAEDPEDVEARLGMARMNAWSDDPSRAAVHYRAVLAAEPNLVEAQRGLADADNRRGLHRAAETRYLALLAQDPEDAGAREGLARAQYWMGESKAALATLGTSSTREGAALEDEIQAERGVRTDLSASRWIDVDDQELETVGIQVDGGVSAQRRLLVEAHAFHTDEPSTPSIDGARFGVGVDERFDRQVSVHARASVLMVGRGLEEDVVVAVGDGDTRTAEEVNAGYLLAETWLTWTSADRTRFDFSYSRVPVYTPRALARGIRADVLGLGADRSLSDRWVARASTAWSGYTDDNRRISGDAELEAGPFRPLRSASGWVAAGMAAFTFEESRDHGYYSPEKYDAVFVRGRLEFPLGRRATLAPDLRLASEREETGDRFGVATGGAELKVGLGRGFGFGAFVRRSTSRLDSSAGYERDGWGVSLFHAP